MATKKTQTQTKIDLDLNNIFKGKTDQPITKHVEDKPKDKPKQAKPKVVNIKKSSIANTLKATGSIKPTKAMEDMLGKMIDIKLDDDLPSYEESLGLEKGTKVNTTIINKTTIDIEIKLDTKSKQKFESEEEEGEIPVPGEIPDKLFPKPEDEEEEEDLLKPEMLPAVIVTTLATTAQNALRKAGYLVPAFHQVAALPGNIQDQIRQLGRNLFKSMTITPTNKIFVVANLGGMGPNTNREVQSVANWIRDCGDDFGDGSIDFDRSIPGYEAETYMYTAAGIAWLLVRDFAGIYIYAWPENDSLFKIETNKLLEKCA
jgi:hypothetical protein